MEETIKTIIYQLKSERDATMKYRNDVINGRFNEGKIVGLDIAIEKLSKLFEE